MRLFQRKSEGKRIDEFWGWVQSEDGRKTFAGLRDQATSTAAANRIGKRLEQVDKGLSWGAGYGPDEPTRFEISASGIRSLVNIVRAVVNHAPSVEGLEVVAFKQPLPEPENFIFEGIEIDIRQTMCRVVGMEEDRLVVDVFVPVASGSSTRFIHEVGFIALDHLLGEEVVMTRLGGLTFQPLAGAPDDLMTVIEFGQKLKLNGRWGPRRTDS